MDPDWGFDWRGPFDGVLKRGIFSNCAVFLLAATLIFVFAAPLRTWASNNARGHALWRNRIDRRVRLWGLFQWGLGIVLLALFSMWGMSNIHQMNGLKNWLSFALSAISVLAFALGGFVHWPEAIVMALAATIGGYAGAPIAKALPASAVRLIVIAVGFGMSAIFFARRFL